MTFGDSSASAALWAARGPKRTFAAPTGTLAIAKFPSAAHDTWNVMAWEKVALDLAREAGIDRSGKHSAEPRRTAACPASWTGSTGPADADGGATSAGSAT
jgi:hypothetical protein